MDASAKMAPTFCPPIKPKITITNKLPDIIYRNDLSRSHFHQHARKKYNPKTMGLTNSFFSSQISYTPTYQPYGNYICPGLSTIDITITNDITIYIDKKYRPGTCQYNVIKEHENYHAAVYREGIAFFQKDIYQAAENAVARLKPEKVRGTKTAEKTSKNQFEQVRNEIKNAIDHISKVMNDKNAEIDTDESYAETGKLCPTW